MRSVVVVVGQAGRQAEHNMSTGAHTAGVSLTAVGPRHGVLVDACADGAPSTAHGVANGSLQQLQGTAHCCGGSRRQDLHHSQHERQALC